MARAYVRTVGAQQTQEFVNPTGFLVRHDSSVNVTISTLANGVAFGSPAITLTTGMLILLKDQTNSWENGVYVVGATAGTTVRHASYTTAASLSRVLIYVNNQDDTSLSAAGPTARWYQNNILTNLTSDIQSWTATPTWNYTFTVPDGITELDILACGGGGGGGGAAGSQSGGANTGGGGGGGGATPQRAKYTVTPGEVLTITLGIGGNAGGRGANSPGAGSAGTNGSSTFITSTNVDMYCPGASGGAGGATGASSPGLGGASFVGGNSQALDSTFSGNGGDGGNALVSGANSNISYYHGTSQTGGTPANGGGGGAGGPGIDLGGVGGNGGAASNAGRTSGGNGSRGSGGGGSGGTTASGGFGNIGSFGGDGCVRISWGG